jgi:DNA-binding NarL/FixJ family response regulator
VKKIRILIADDQDIAREGMRRILSSIDDFEIVGDAAVLPDVIRKARELIPDIILLDMQWLGDDLGGVETIRRIVRELPEIKIIAITVYNHLIEPARNAGAQAAVTKEIPMKQLIEEIRGIYYLNPLNHVKVVATSQEKLPQKLSSRELDVLGLLAQGKSDKEIALTLEIAESTAKNHVSNIIRKLSVTNRAGAVAFGYQNGLIRQ